MVDLCHLTAGSEMINLLMEECRRVLLWTAMVGFDLIYANLLLV
jgi:hypothetical protein